MKRWIQEQGERLPVTAAYDVVVVGGGIAGVAAALAAARAGGSVALVEKAYALGGLATLGNVNVYLPLCDGRGHQVIEGLGEELLKASIEDGYDEIPACWRPGGDPQERLEHRYRVRFNPASLILLLEELILKEGIDLYYDTRFCDVALQGGRIGALIVENKGGRSAMTSRTVVDASGDADVCARAGEDTVSLATNVRAGWFFYTRGGEVERVSLTKPYDPYGQEVQNGGRGYAGDRPEDVTAQVIDTRRLIRQRLEKLRQTSDGETIRPFLLPTIPGFRMTRRLKGEIELGEEHERHIFFDSVGMTGDWRKAGPVYYIPLRALAAPHVPNLITAGRCISSASAWDITRVIPTCAVTGQAAGTAAALASCMASPSFADMEIETLQAHLRQQGVPLKKRVPRQTATERPEKENSPN
ncbi:MAG: FAD-dependent oxidoreductase [Anaerolineae bacterium]